MHRMSGLDARFLYMETPSLHMHTLKIAIVDPSTVPGGYSFDQVKDNIASRLHLLPPFRWRMVEVPLGFHHPVWIEDPDFDLDFHVRRIGVPPPGSRRELDEMISYVASHQLPRDRPLWQMFVMEGLADGTVAFVVKLHHAAADGVAAAELLANVMSPDPDAIDPEPPGVEWVPDERPTTRRLIADAFRDHLSGLRDLPDLVVRTARGRMSVSRRKKTSVVTPPRPIFDSPRTSFNGALTPHRSFASLTVPLADLKRAKGGLAVTLNDVVLGVVGGAIRSYLHQRGELPERSLIASVPVSTDRPEDARRLGGNRVGTLFCTLRTDIADPVERVGAIHDVTKVSKELHNLLGVEVLQEEWIAYTPPRPYQFFMRLYSRLRLADRHDPPVNAVVSNVPGPRESLYVGGARLAALLSVGPILEGIGLNITVWSYRDDMNFSVITCPELIPEVHDITDAISVSIRELLESVGSATASAS